MDGIMLQYRNPVTGATDTVVGTNPSFSPNCQYLTLNVVDDTGATIETWGEPIGYTVENITEMCQVTTTTIHLATRKGVRERRLRFLDTIPTEFAIPHPSIIEMMEAVVN